MPQFPELKRSLTEFIKSKNDEWLFDFSLQFVLGSLTCLFTFFLLWTIAAFMFGTIDLFSPSVLGFLGIYFGAAFYAAKNDIDPVASLPAANTKHEAVQDIEQLTSFVTGVPNPQIMSRSGVAGASMFLIAGPQLLIKAWNSWRKRLILATTDYDSCVDVLFSLHTEPKKQSLDPRSLAILAHFDLVITEIEPNSGAVVVRLNAKSKQLFH